MSVNTKFVYLRLKPHKSLLVKGSHSSAGVGINKATIRFKRL